MNLEHEQDLELPIRGCISRIASLSTRAAMRPPCITTTCRILATQEALEILLAHDLVGLAIDDINRHSVNVLEEHVPVLVLRRASVG